ncbi:MAG: 3-dehydroquinate synthase [Deltaproteobacteria bacterium]|nr:3-dehydroquinate synthase [Deltaproteobacteria bacterium]
MKSVVIHGATGDSLVMIGESINNVAEYLSGRKAVIVTDVNVYRYYHDMFPSDKVIQIGTGEAVKTLDTVRDIIEKLIEMETDRSEFIIGIGGGIVCDVAGFTASIYERGLRFGFVSTTLLSQVDASVGGKNGVNFEGYKNMVGVFNQPEFVICDPDLLKTLPEKEILNGCAEIVKHAAIADEGLFCYLEENYRGILELDKDVIEKAVHDSIVIKSRIVNRDEREMGERRKLNFGHTIGHALEKVTGITHGEAVSIGMTASALISEKMGLLKKKDRSRIEGLLRNLGLPTSIQADRGKIIDALGKDKKRENQNIHFVILKEIGEAIIKDIDIREVPSLIPDYTE